MADKEPLDNFYEQPTAADESGQGLDDVTLSELSENGPETRFFDLGTFFGDLWRRFIVDFRHFRSPFLLRSLTLWALAEL